MQIQPLNGSVFNEKQHAQSSTVSLYIKGSTKRSLSEVLHPHKTSNPNIVSNILFIIIKLPQTNMKCKFLLGKGIRCRFCPHNHVPAFAMPFSIAVVKSHTLSTAFHRIIPNYSFIVLWRNYAMCCPRKIFLNKLRQLITFMRVMIEKNSRLT